jgi:hypothetical protein
MRSTLASLFFAAAASVTATLTMSTPVRAEVEYPYCGHIPSQGGSNSSCSFATIEQCRVYVSTGGYCERNPRTSALAQTPRRAMTR